MARLYAAPALEIVEIRGPFAGNLPLAMADNAQQKAYVTGPEVLLTAQNRDLAHATLSVEVDGVHSENASGAAVMGGGLLSIVWLANKLAEFDLPLEAGMCVMSGSFTRQYAAWRGSRVTSTFVTTPEGRAPVLAACPAPDILVNNAGGPKPGNFRDWSRDDWIAALDANMLAPIELMKATVDGMMARRFGRIVNITSSAVKAPIDIPGLSNGARSGRTGFVAGLARKTVSQNVTINNLLPGPLPTDRLSA